MNGHDPTPLSNHQIIRLNSHRMIWLGSAIVVLSIGAFAALAAVAFFVAGTGWPERLGLGAMGTAVAISSLLFGIRAFRLGRGHPCLLVEPDALVIQHPGVLRERVVIPKSEVETICIGNLVKPRRQPPSAGKRPLSRLRSYSRWLDAGGQFPHFTASRVLPDLSFPFYYPLAGPFSNLLIVLRRPFDLGEVPRRGLGILSDEGSVYRGPVRGARIRGLLATVTDTQEALRVLSPWGVIQEEPTEEMIAWVSPARVRR